METTIDSDFLQLKQYIEEILHKDESKPSCFDNLNRYSSKYYCFSFEEEQYILKLLQEKLATTDKKVLGRIVYLFGHLHIYTNYSYNDLQLGFEFIEQAIDLNCADALNFKGSMHNSDQIDSPPNFPEAQKLFEQAIALNHSDAMCNLALMYKKGDIDGQPNFQKAKELYKQAIALNHPDAMRQLALMYKKGDLGSQPNIPKAKKLLKQAIALNYSDAMCELAFIYQIGKINGQFNLTKTKKLLEQAMSLNDPDAKRMLGTFYNNLAHKYQEGEIDGQPNFPKAKELFEKAITLDHCIAMSNLAYMYKKGQIDNTKDFITAAMLFRKAWGLSPLPPLKNSIESLLKISTEFPVRYHCTMALHPESFLSLLKESPGIIGECVLHDDLLTNEQKSDMFFNGSIESTLIEYFSHTLLAEYYLYFAQVDKNQVEIYCQESLNHYIKALSYGKKLPEFTQRLNYFIAKQYDELGDNYQEAIMLCFHIRDFVPAQHLLAHLLFTHDYNMLPLQRHLLCLHWSQQKTTLPTPKTHDGLINLILNNYQEKLIPVQDKPKMEQLTWFLEQNQQSMNQSMHILAGWVLIGRLAEINDFYDQVIVENQYRELSPYLPLIPDEILIIWQKTIEGYISVEETQILPPDKKRRALCMELAQALNKMKETKHNTSPQSMSFFNTNPEIPQASNTYSSCIIC